MGIRGEREQERGSDGRGADVRGRVRRRERKGVNGREEMSCRERERGREGETDVSFLLSGG